MVKQLGAAAASAIAASSSCLVLVGAASAESIPNANDTTYKADNAEHTYCFSGTVGGTGVYTDSMSYLDTATDMTDTYMSACSTNTDVRFRELPASSSYWLPGERGARECLIVKPGDPSICQSNQVSINVELIFLTAENSSHFGRNLRKVIRHEVGHTVGLNHDGSTWESAAGQDWKDVTVSGVVPDVPEADKYSYAHWDWIDYYY